MRRPALFLLAMLAAPAAGAADLVCRPEIRCAGEACRATDPADDEAATYIRNPMGAAPELYLGEGRWLRAARSARDGALVWTAAAGPGEAVVLGVAREGGAVVLTRVGPGAAGGVYVWSGRCTGR